MYITYEELETLYYHIDCLVNHPSRLAVIPGCDCGCGGDSYDWDSIDSRSSEAIEHLKDKFDIELSYK